MLFLLRFLFAFNFQSVILLCACIEFFRFVLLGFLIVCWISQSFVRFAAFSAIWNNFWTPSSCSYSSGTMILWTLGLWWWVVHDPEVQIFFLSLLSSTVFLWIICSILHLTLPVFFSILHFVISWPTETFTVSVVSLILKFLSDDYVSFQFIPLSFLCLDYCSAVCSCSSMYSLQLL